MPLGFGSDEEDDDRRVVRDEEDLPSLAGSRRMSPITDSSASDMERNVALSRGMNSQAMRTLADEPSPAQSQTTTDRTELGRLQTTGSGISQLEHSPKRMTRIGGHILHGLDIAGQIAAPDVEALIPGTQAHHAQLVDTQRGKIAQDVKDENEVQTGQHLHAQTRLANAQADQAENPAAKPKEESWQPMTGYTDQDGTPLLHEVNSGQVVRASDHKPTTGFKQAAPKQDKPDQPEQQFVDEYMKKNPGATIAQAQHAFKQNEVTPEKGSFMPLYDEKGNVTGSWNAATGAVTKAPSALPGNTSQGHGIQQHATAASDKEAAPYKAMVESASEAHTLQDMANKGNASADVDLVLSFFKMMKGAGGSGVRFTQQEQQMILGARNTGQDLVAIGQKVIGEGQPLTPEQRQHMVDVIDMHAKAAQSHLDAGQQGGGGGGEQPPSQPAPGMKWQHRTANGKTEWRQVPAQ